MIVIFTEELLDPHVAYVKPLLIKNKVPFICIDSGSLPSDYSIIEFEHNKANIKLWQGNQIIDLSEVTSFWHRRPSEIKISDYVDKSYVDIVRTEWRVFLNNIWELTKDKFWVSPPNNIRLAEIKGLQLKMASEFGMLIPNTIITNSPSELIRFISENKKIIGKKLFSPGVSRENVNYMFATTIIEKISNEMIDSLPLCPCIFQEYIDKEFDIRLTIIGNEVFPVAIYSQNETDSIVDYRMAQQNLMHLKHEIILDLPKHIIKSCLKLVKYFGLNFASLDLIKTKKGQYFFVELNPNGQWLWCELTTGLKMGEAMVKLLSK